MQDTDCVQKPVDREVVELLSKVCQKLSTAKLNLSELSNLNKISPDDYFKIRNIIYDCYELMAVYCDCAPIRLIAGQVDDIMKNFEE